MLDWILAHPVLSEVWFVYVTFHDLVQWALMLAIGYTAWGQRRKAQEKHELALALKVELDHVHEELHNHMEEDAQLHAHLGQGGMRRGELRDGSD